MANILSFIEVTNITGVHIKMDIPKEKVINFHIQDGQNFHFKACASGIFYTNLDEPSMIINPTNVFINVYYFLSTVKQNS